MDPVFCLLVDCPGHPTARQVCWDIERYGTPYDMATRQLNRAHAIQMSNLRIRQAEQRLALAHRFAVAKDHQYWNARLRALRSRRDEFDVTV